MTHDSDECEHDWKTIAALVVTVLKCRKCGKRIYPKPEKK